MLSLLFPFLGKYAADNMKAAVQKAKMQAVSAALLGGALFFALFFICLMSFLFLSGFMPPVQAAAVLALIWLLIAFTGFMCMKLAADKQKQQKRALMNEEQKKLLTGTALAAMPSLLSIGAKSYKSLGVLAVLATGAAAAYGLLHKSDAEADRDRDF